MPALSRRRCCFTMTAFTWQDLKVERYSGAGQTDRFAEVAQRTVASQPDVIFCVSGRMVTQFKAATATIPIVAITGDPIALGVVTSLAHPGGNITGAVVDPGNEFYAKYLEMLRTINPNTSRVAFLTPRAVWEFPSLFAPVRTAAEQIGISLIPALLEITGR